MTPCESQSLADRIAEQAAHLDAATHRLLADLRAFDESGEWHAHGARSCAAWLAWRVSWDLRTANEHVRVANRLGKLPRIDEALRRGEMSYAKVRAMVRVATPENEEMLLEEARYTTGGQLEKICRQYASVRRHDHAATPKDDRDRRSLTRRDTADGMIKIEALLHPEEAALVWAAIERVASERCREREAARRREQQSTESPSRASSAEPDTTSRPVPSGFDRADALLAISEQVLRGTSPDRAPVDLVLTASVESLARPKSVMEEDATRAGWVLPAERWDEVPFDPHEVGELGDGTCVSTTAARRLACDCGLTMVLEGAHGSPVTIGRKRRTIPPAMKRAMIRRDATCRFPGCGARVFLQGHHVEHWADGGATELRNLISLCGFHHRHVHEYGYRIELTCEGVARFLDRRGAVVQDVPERSPLPDLGWPAILAANQGLGITSATPACGWNGEPVDYHLCVDALVAMEEGET